MQNKSALFDQLIQKTLAAGADRAAVISSREVVTDVSFLEMCRANHCGMWGKCYTCPPDVGNIEDLIASLSRYEHVLVYQRVGVLEDSFDVNGMHDARRQSAALAQRLRSVFSDERIDCVLHLGPGACGVCSPCAKVEAKPCRHPDLAISSLEAYGINVSALAKSASMPYINGQNTVTYFGAVFFTE